jgi:hypothetical protein
VHAVHLIKKKEPMPFERLLRYKTVREMFGWRSNNPIYRAVMRGDLVRVRIGQNSNSWRITAASAEKMLADSLAPRNSEQEKEYLDRAKKHSAMMNAARKLPLPDPTEDVLLDPEQITRNAEMGKAERDPEVWDHYNNRPVPAQPTPAPQQNADPLTTYMNARGSAKVQAYRALDWKTRNRIIESQRAPEPVETLESIRAEREARRLRRGY